MIYDFKTSAGLSDWHYILYEQKNWMRTIFMLSNAEVLTGYLVLCGWHFSRQTNTDYFNSELSNCLIWCFIPMKGCTKTPLETNEIISKQGCGLKKLGNSWPLSASFQSKFLLSNLLTKQSGANFDGYRSYCIFTLDCGNNGIRWKHCHFIALKQLIAFYHLPRTKRGWIMK